SQKKESDLTSWSGLVHLPDGNGAKLTAEENLFNERSGPAHSLTFASATSVRDSPGFPRAFPSFRPSFDRLSSHVPSLSWSPNISLSFHSPTTSFLLLSATTPPPPPPPSRQRLCFQSQLLIELRKHGADQCRVIRSPVSFFSVPLFPQVQCSTYPQLHFAPVSWIPL
ncbi:hypothetical protein CRG98_050015, partial [Punica granatum]